MYKQPIIMWFSDEIQASFNSTFVINIYRNTFWNAGEDLAFLLALNLLIPDLLKQVLGNGLASPMLPMTANQLFSYVLGNVSTAIVRLNYELLF